ncbi:MAG: hypothetical protein NT164_03475 [Verrucomicrobiae bacterium]|nr:hypothetical protein [Verrucomicrobiae bacterium]
MSFFKFKFVFLKLCNSLAPARLAPAGLPSAVDPAAATPHVCFIPLIASIAVNLFFLLASISVISKKRD